MTLFGKGTWTRMHMPNEAIAGFAHAFTDKRQAYKLSAVGARARLISAMARPDTDSGCEFGINPPSAPCGDIPEPLDQKRLDSGLLPHLSAYMAAPDDLDFFTVIPETARELEDESGLVESIPTKESAFRLVGAPHNVWGFWFVFMEIKTPDDLPSLKEHATARTMKDCFKRLSSADRKEITADLTEMGLTKTVNRKAVPIILDGDNNAIWVASTSNRIVEALNGWFMAYMGTRAELTQLTLGENPDWPLMALGTAWEKNTYALEAREAYDAWIERQNASTDADLDSLETDLTGEGEDAKAEEGAHVWGTNALAALNLDSGIQIQFETPGFISLGRLSGGVGVGQGMDALHLLYTIPEASITSGQLVISAGTEDTGFFRARVEFTGAIAKPIVYRNLDIHMSNKVLASLEAPILESLGLTAFKSLADRDIDQGHHRRIAGRVNRLWFIYLLQLQEFESGLITSMCEALDLDPNGIEPQPTRSNRTIEVLGQGEEPAMSEETSAIILSAAATLKEAFESNLEEGESVTLTIPGKSTTITKGKKKPTPRKSTAPEESSVEL